MPQLAPAPHTVCPPFDSRQAAYTFNQPLSFDTSSVTNMRYMFLVRSSPCALPPICSRAPPLHVEARLLACTLTPHRICPPCDSRQNAQTFNQPLSFDTSSVTSMQYMFLVRSSPCPAPNLQSSSALHAACAAVARRASRLPASAPRPTPYTLLSILASTRMRSTSR